MPYRRKYPRLTSTAPTNGRDDRYRRHGAARHGVMSRMSTIRPEEFQNAVDSGIVVSLIQKGTLVGWLNSNPIPSSRGSDGTPESPLACPAGLRAIPTRSL